jgi:predicted ATPase
VLGFVPSQGLAGAGTAFSYSGLSIGTRRVIQMLTYLVCDQAAVMLLEQPEDSIHSGLLRSIMDVFKSYSDRCQVVFTTHAHQAIDLMDPNAVRLVRSEHGKTMVEKLTQSQIRSAQDFMLEQGTLSEYLDSL